MRGYFLYFGGRKQFLNEPWPLTKHCTIRQKQYTTIPLFSEEYYSSIVRSVAYLGQDIVENGEIGPFFFPPGKQYPYSCVKYFDFFFFFFSKKPYLLALKPPQRFKR